jgi:hypothetical protein
MSKRKSARTIKARSASKMEPRRASLTPDTQYTTSKIFSTLQLEAPALLTLCPAQQTECHHVQHPHPPVLEAHRVIH